MSTARYSRYRPSKLQDNVMKITCIQTNWRARSDTHVVVVPFTQPPRLILWAN